MTKIELLEPITNGENSGLEFKRDDIDNRALAKELVAFIQGIMEHNGTQPDVIEDEERFMVRLWK